MGSDRFTIRRSSCHRMMGNEAMKIMSRILICLAVGCFLAVLGVIFFFPKLSWPDRVLVITVGGCSITNCLIASKAAKDF